MKQMERYYMQEGEVWHLTYDNGDFTCQVLTDTDDLCDGACCGSDIIFESLYDAVADIQSDLTELGQ
jgi:hypothetical protein